MLEFIRADWPAPDNIIAGTSTRVGGVSQGCWSSLNLASHVEDNPEHVDENRRRLYEFLDLPSEPVWLEQVHGCDVIRAESVNETCRSDASVTAKPGVVCAVLTADCLPLLVCDRNGKQVAAIHAGWRGLASGIIEQTIRAMEAEPRDMLVWLGPAIGPGNFEVGDDVYHRFTVLNDSAVSAFTRRGDRWLCDLYKLARLRLQAIGVSNIFGGGFCTYDEVERFYSYRRDGITGRMVNLVWINP